MSFLSEAVNALYGTYRLARMDPGGMAYFNVSEQGFRRSFRAAALVFPMFVLLIAARYGIETIDAPLWRYLAVEFIAYVIGWVALPVLMIEVCRQFERTEKYVGFIVAYNWATVLQDALYMPVALLSISGQLTGSGGLFMLLVMAAIIIYTWFIAKTALDIPGSTAAGVVVIDLVVSFAINMYAEALLATG